MNVCSVLHDVWNLNLGPPGSHLQAFLDALQNQAEASSSIIGQFGVGFYSTFMVANRVDVYTQSVEPGSPAYKWSSDG